MKRTIKFLLALALFICLIAIGAEGGTDTKRDKWKDFEKWISKK